jgi:hypothetical protein
MHGPGLSRNDRARRESIAHEIKELVGEFTLGRRRDNPFEEAGCCAMETKTYQ